MQGIEASVTSMEVAALPWKLQLEASMKFSSGSFRESVMKVVVEVSMEVSEEHHLVPLASAHFHQFQSTFTTFQAVPGTFHCFHGSFHASCFRGRTRALPWKLPLPLVRHFQRSFPLLTSMEASTTSVEASATSI